MKTSAVLICAAAMLTGTGVASLAASDAGSGPTTGATQTNDAGSGPTKGSQRVQPDNDANAASKANHAPAGTTPGPASTGGAQPVTPGMNETNSSK